MDLDKINTPCYLIDERSLIRNLEILKGVRDRTGAKILLAQKAFAMFSMYPLLAKYLDGTTASGLFEARLGYEEMGNEVHIFSPAYKEEEFEEILSYGDHIVFNSFTQWNKFGGSAAGNNKSCGIRINPECSTQSSSIYDPCAPGSRFGVTAANFPETLPQGIEGLHFHTLCEQNSDDLEKTLDAVCAKFGKHLHNIKWLNFGGGHHITREDYDIDLLCACIEKMQKYGLEIYLEPGEAVALNAGYLVATVLDIVENGDVTNLILDTSAACHMPDVLEMPYRPPCIGGDMKLVKKFTYRLTANSCLAGDVIGDYSFDKKITIGNKLMFGDMAHYTMVKNNMFNGINLPSIKKIDVDGNIVNIKEFCYSDYKNRLS